MQKKQISVVVIIDVLLMAYFLLPDVGSVGGAQGHIAIMGLCLLVSFDRHMIHRIPLYYGMILAFALFEVVFVVFYHDTFRFSYGAYNISYYLKDIFLRYLDLFTVTVAIKSLEYRNREECNRLLCLALAMIAFTFINSIIVTQSHPEIVRDMASQADFDISTRGVANYNIAYASTLTAPIALEYLEKKSKLRVLSIIYICLLTFFLISCAFTLSLLVLFVEVVLFSFLHFGKQNNMLRAMMLMALFLGIGVAWLHLSDLLIWLSKNVDSSSLQVRILEMNSFLQTGQIGGDMLGRLNIYNTSLQTFLKHPVTGVLFSFTNNSGVLTGDHSRALDILARYGAFSLLYFGGFYLLFKDYASYVKKKHRDSFVVVCLGALLIEIVNPMYEGFILFYGFYLFYLAFGKEICR